MMNADVSTAPQARTSVARVLSRVLGVALAFTAAVTSCGGSTGAPTAGGESHFLAYCDGACGAGLSCISGVCTRSCLVGQSSCGDLARGAECTDQSIEPGAVAVCDLACSSDRDCSSLGPRHRCESGYCRGGGPIGLMEASCRVAHRTYPSGSTDIPPRTGCGSCTCSDGELSCTEEPCSELGVPLVLCPGTESGRPIAPSQVVTDPIEVKSYALVGNSITFEVAHGGGCAPHDYALCFDPAARASYPSQFTVILIHDAHEDGCNAYLQETLKFDLSKIAETHNRGSQTNGGLVSTPFGLYAFGEASCMERTRAVTEQMERAMQNADTSCTSAADCASAYPATHCSSQMCPVAVSHAGAAELQQTVDTINAQVCDVGAGCTAPAGAPCDIPPPVQCIDGRCQY